MFWGGGFIVGPRAAAGTVHICKASMVMLAIRVVSLRLHVILTVP